MSGAFLPFWKLLWDGPNLKIANDETANRLLHREYRQGWTF